MVSKNKLFLKLLIFMNLGLLAESANIVFLHPYATYSHIVSTMPLADALVERGHHVTFISSVPAKHPNPKIVNVIPKTLVNFLNGILKDGFDVSIRIKKETPNIFSSFDELNVEGCKLILSSPEFRSWMNEFPKVDLIIVDNSHECGLGISYKLKSKTILLSTVALWGKLPDLIGLPEESLTTFADNSYKTSMSFFERVKNTLLPLAWLFEKNRHVNSFEAVIKEHLSISDLPSMYELEKNISLVFTSGNFISEQQRSLPPMFISIPGLHIKEHVQPLSREVATFIDSNNDDGTPNEGFIYISLGTVVKPQNLPKRIMDVFMNSIKAFPHIRFLWRWDGEFPKETPKNLLLSKWFEQQDVLGHPKIKGFVTQAGRPSVQEALAKGVPMITFPILGDQDYNAFQMEDLGLAINLEIGEVDVTTFQNAISRLLYDENLKVNALRNGKLFTDLPTKPLENAVFWTEYVLRHDNFSHLKPLARNQTWYQRRMLDVWIFLFSIILISLFILLFISRQVFIKIFHISYSNSKLKIS